MLPDLSLLCHFLLESRIGILDVSNTVELFAVYFGLSASPSAQETEKSGQAEAISTDKKSIEMYQLSQNDGWKLTSR